MIKKSIKYFVLLMLTIILFPILVIGFFITVCIWPFTKYDSYLEFLKKEAFNDDMIGMYILVFGMCFIIGFIIPLSAQITLLFY